MRKSRKWLLNRGPRLASEVADLPAELAARFGEWHKRAIDCFVGVTEEAAVWRPARGPQSLLWQLWHIARWMTGLPGQSWTLRLVCAAPCRKSRSGSETRLRGGGVGRPISNLAWQTPPARA
ncbi:MAG: DinB family protein [Chloroflexi bacterium]|nr:MAG: DinB family protein [Chloroflexota bacterium]